MPKIQGGGATGGVTSGQVEHSDWVGEMMKLPQANSGVLTKVESRQSARPNEYKKDLPGERSCQ